MKQKGFTLLEVLIVLMIMAVIATLTAQSIQRSTSIKTKIQTNIDQQAALRNALSVIERDINLAFHYHDPNYEVELAIRKNKQKKAVETGVPIEEEPLKEPVKLTQFQGEAQKIDFTSISGVRTTPEAKESDQIEVGYEVRGCKSPFNPEKNMQCLFRRASPVIDDDINDGGDETVVLENVINFQLRYFGEGKDDWVDTWKTKEGADDTTKDKFPNAVEITLETEESGKKLKMLTVAELRFPNNRKTEEESLQNAQPGSSR